MADLLCKDEVYNIVGAAMEVHKELGNGYLEGVYQEALWLEMDKANIPFEEQKELKIKYKGNFLDKKYIADFICYNSVIVEIKALNKLTTEHESQLLNYLKTTGIKVGILINFGSKSLEYKRMVL
ncbi:MAG: GxxExxY protein [Paludibacteraceae bacterium]|nr:GxxExxY protein [Paludibacteraceae bacterium]MBN2787006.1 GxxExxY protein [Paludibacteraceae bacterium]